MKNRRKQKLNTNKGFTLVELVVILVILGILASFMVPALTGYIDKAKDSTLIGSCRSCVVAAQSLLSESYAEDNVNFSLDEAEVAALAEVKGTVSDTDYDSSAVLWHLNYTEGDKTVVYCARGGCSECGYSDKFTIVEGTSYQKRLDEAMSAVSEKFKELRNSGEITTETLDSININTVDGPNITKLFNELTPSQRDFLNTVSWSVKRTSNGVRIYFTTENYGTQSATNIRVYKYNMDTHQYEYADKGTVIENGKVTVRGNGWSGFQDTISELDIPN